MADNCVIYYKFTQYEKNNFNNSGSYWFGCL